MQKFIWRCCLFKSSTTYILLTSLTNVDVEANSTSVYPDKTAPKARNSLILVYNVWPKGF